MGEMLKQLRDLTIIIGIYLYFIAWVYIHFYYEQFGISTEAVKIDYNSYLVYSYNVITSSNFLFWVKILIALIIVSILLMWIIGKLSTKHLSFKKINIFLLQNNVAALIKKTNQQYPLLLLIILLVIVFPPMFRISKQVAIDHYHQDRIDSKYLKTVQFIFRKDADMMSPSIALDSALPKKNIFYSDISIIKNDPQQLLRLLGESDKYYIVLQQRPYNKTLGMPQGYVYFIDKQDILLTKIILRSF